jgi:cell fate regulator YaaT (PSP1 superfamily)
MAEFDTPEERSINVTFDGRTRAVTVSAQDRVEDIARLYRLDTRQYAFYDEDDGQLDLGSLVAELDGIRIIQNPKGA